MSFWQTDISGHFGILVGFFSVMCCSGFMVLWAAGGVAVLCT